MQTWRYNLDKQRPNVKTRTFSSALVRYKHYFGMWFINKTKESDGNIRFSEENLILRVRKSGGKSRPIKSHSSSPTPVLYSWTSVTEIPLKMILWEKREYELGGKRRVRRVDKMMQISKNQFERSPAAKLETSRALHVWASCLALPSPCLHRFFQIRSSSLP